MKEDKLITVLMPVYNSKKYLSIAIESILNQTYKNLELIIIDDSSTDNSYEIAESYKTDKRVTVVKNKKYKGISGAINTGLEIAKGDYITRMDSDDISLPTRLEKQIKFLKNNPKYNACSVNIYHIDEKGRKISDNLIKESKAPAEWVMIYQNPLANPPILYDRKIIEANNIKYNKNFKVAEDYNFLKDYLLHGGKIIAINEALYEYRFHVSSISVNNYDLINSLSIEIINEYIRKISKLSIPEKHDCYTVYKFFKNSKEEINIKENIEFQKNLLKDFSKHFNWTKEEVLNAENYIYENLERTLERKTTIIETNNSIINKSIQILKDEGLISLIKKTYKKYTEIINYLIVGVLTTIVSLVTKWELLFTILDASNALELQSAIIISWIIAVLFAYITNRIFVFKSKSKKILKEISSFISARLLTLALEMVIMWFFITLLKLNSDVWVLIWTMLVQVIVTILNYLFSKILVFKHKESK